MCGIVGVAHSAIPAVRPPIDRMRDTLRHRGPDDAGTWWSDDGRVGFGHRRLSILDLSPLGHQPMMSRDGRCVVILNGEICNFAELRATLVARGHSFRGTGDTEVLLAAYQQWGVDCLPRLRGPWGDVMRDTVRGAEPGLFDQRVVDQLFAAQERGLSNQARLFALTMLELWRREYAIGLPAVDRTE